MVYFIFVFVSLKCGFVSSDYHQFMSQFVIHDDNFLFWLKNRLIHKTKSGIKNRTRLHPFLLVLRDVYVDK